MKLESFGDKRSRISESCVQLNYRGVHTDFRANRNRSDKRLSTEFDEFKYEAADIFDGLKTVLSESNSVAQNKIVNCVAMLSNRLESVRESSSDAPSGLCQERVQQLQAWHRRRQ